MIHFRITLEDRNLLIMDLNNYNHFIKTFQAKKNCLPLICKNNVQEYFDRCCDEGNLQEACWLAKVSMKQGYPVVYATMIVRYLRCIKNV